MTTVLFPIFVRQGKSRTRFKVGYINQTGNVVIDPVFDDGTRFYEGLASVKVRGRWGAINTDGEFVIQPAAWGPCRFHEGLASISVKGKWGIIDRSGEFLVSQRYDYIGPFRDGLALFRLGEGNHGRYGFLDKNGSEAIPPLFHDAKEFSEGLAAASVGNLWGYITPSGVFQITPQFDGSGKGKRWPDTRAGRFVNRLAPVWSGQDYYRFIDTTGRYAEEKESRLGFSPPSGFIDVQGWMVIEPTFFSAESFRDGLCLVTTQDSIGYIDTSGGFVWQGAYVEYGVLS